MASDSPIPIVLCVDVEPDARLVDRRRAAGWTGFEKMWPYVRALRRRIEDRHRVAVRMWWGLRMDPQVKETHGSAAWAAERYSNFFAEALESGDELGLHVHAYRWDDAAGDWVADHGNRDWIAECVEVSADAFRDAFRQSCRVYRMGDRYIDGATLALMESLGGRLDVTVEPGYGPLPAVFVEQLHTGSLPDFRTAPRRLYQPSREDFRRADASGERTISVLPLTTWRIPALLALVRRAYVAARSLGNAPLPEVLKRERMMTMGLALPPLFFRRMLDDLLADESLAHLVSVDRTHIGNEPEKLERIETNLRHLLSHPMAHRFVFVRPGEVVDSLAAVANAASPVGPRAAAM